MTVRIGFLGAGFIATYHGKMLRRSGTDHRIVAVYDADPTRAAAFAEASGGQAVASEEELFAAGLDAVYVCTWTSEHPRLVAAAAAAGLAVFCEKPLAVDLPSAIAVAGSVEQAGVVNQVGLVLRDSPALLALRELVGRPDNGRVMTVVFRDDQYLPTQGVYASTWRGDASLAGAGTLLEHSIHDLDLLEWLLGPVTDVAGRTREFHALPGIDDVSVVMLGFASGATGTLTSVWHDVLARSSLRRIEIFCERTWIALEGDVSGPLRWSHDDGDEQVLEGESLLRFLAERGVTPESPDGRFVRSVAAGTASTPSVTDALRPHLLADLAYRSAARGGETIAVPPGVPGG